MAKSTHAESLDQAVGSLGSAALRISRDTHFQYRAWRGMFRGAILDVLRMRAGVQTKRTVQLPKDAHEDR